MQRPGTEHFRVDGVVLDVWESVGGGGTVGGVRDDASRQLRDLAHWAAQWADYLDFLSPKARRIKMETVGFNPAHLTLAQNETA
jgi:hypothetical protein